MISTALRNRILTVLVALVTARTGAVEGVAAFDLAASARALEAHWAQVLSRGPELRSRDLPAGRGVAQEHARWVSAEHVAERLRALAGQGYAEPFVATLSLVRNGDTAVHDVFWSLSRTLDDGGREMVAGCIRHVLQLGSDGRWVLASVAWADRPGEVLARLSIPGAELAAELPVPVQPLRPWEGAPLAN